MSLKIESKRLTELATRASELRRLEKIDFGIAFGGIAETYGSLVLYSLKKGDPSQLLLACAGGLGIGMAALFAGIMRDSGVQDLEQNARNMSMSEQAQELTRRVESIPQDTFSDLWNTLKELQESTTVESGEFGDIQASSIETIYQAFARRAGESQETSEERT